ncbi:hypothetical protein X777_10411 [Ooceraea biroi]|uniref:Tudor domain-containing protein n=1 Tax=Ooceraea biroi TaxID=2015173 RepID=A0A026W4H0_OOCBI|nr:hypothetical protein X777_10411 [Ooceraea biroi]
MEIKGIQSSLLTRRPLAVTVIRVDSPGLIWIHIKNSEKDYQEMREDLQVMMQRRGRYLGCYPDQVQVNQVIAIRDGSQWHRGYITAIEGDLARITLGDWGRKILRPLHECHRLPVRLHELAWQAIPCSLFRIGPMQPSEIWRFETRQMTKMLAEHKNGWIRIRKAEDDAAIVDLTIDNHPEDGRYDFKDILSKMGFVQQAPKTFKPDMYLGLTRRP